VSRRLVKIVSPAVGDTLGSRARPIRSRNVVSRRLVKVVSWVWAVGDTSSSRARPIWSRNVVSLRLVKTVKPAAGDTGFRRPDRWDADRSNTRAFHPGTVLAALL
jgi:hypothetical protein